MEFFTHCMKITICNLWENDEDIYLSAAKNGHLQVIKWCRSRGMQWPEYICSKAAISGQLDILKWCRSNGAPWKEWICLDAAVTGLLVCYFGIQQLFSCSLKYSFLKNKKRFNLNNLFLFLLVTPILPPTFRIGALL